MKCLQNSLGVGDKRARAAHRLHRFHGLIAGMWVLEVWWEGPGRGKSFSDTPQVHPWSLSARASCFALPSPSLDSFQNVPRQLLLRRLKRLLLGLYLLHPCSRVLEGLRSKYPPQAFARLWVSSTFLAAPGFRRDHGASVLDPFVRSNLLPHFLWGSLC